MRRNAELERWRSDSAGQRNAQHAFEAARRDWQEGAAGEVLAALEAYGADANLLDCQPLRDAMTDRDMAERLVSPLIDSLVAAQRIHPLGQIPFRHLYSNGSGLLQLARSGRATLSLVFYEAVAVADEAASTIAFADGERHELCLAGEAVARILRLEKEAGDQAEIAAERVRLCAGTVLELGADKTKRLESVAGRLVLLRLSREAIAPGPSREYRIADGALVHCASGDHEESRDEIAIALLARMGRTDVVPALAQIVKGERSDHLRWQALRAALALDTAEGFALLTGLAEDSGDMLAPTAIALRDRLLADYPELARLETRLCPA
ncbi:MAG: hypothetical protein MK010_07150 [Erythrobacter sp.]|nr:hypothetical protein [Erythrobacter sp.]